MNRKPNFSINREQRLKEAQKQLEQEEQLTYEGKTTQTTLVLEESLLYDVKEILLKRKRDGIKPYSLSAVMRKYLKELVKKEKDKNTI